MIKMVMALRHDTLPRTLHVDRADHQSGLVGGRGLAPDRGAGMGAQRARSSRGSLVVRGQRHQCAPDRRRGPARAVAETSALTEGPVPAGRAGNAGEILSENGVLSRLVLPFLLSGRTEQVLRVQAERLSEFVNEHPRLSIADVGRSLADRPVFEHRGVVVCGEREELLRGLEALACGAQVPALVGGVASVAGGLACLFTGQGSQRVGMGRELYESHEVFREALDEICDGFAGQLELPLLEVIFGEETTSPGSAERSAGTMHLDRTAFTQAGLFALEVALFRLIEAWGVRPDYLLGHSSVSSRLRWWRRSSRWRTHALWSRLADG